MFYILYTHTHIYMYIYICTYTHTYISNIPLNNWGRGWGRGEMLGGCGAGTIAPQKHPTLIHSTNILKQSYPKVIR